ncbi:MAG: response regulator [Methylococcaceae bacterium]|nr:MAG: response regulator [Methylococcaceae bacterium]
MGEHFPANEIERLQTRLTRLAEEQANLQLVIRLIEQLNPLPGLDNMVQAMLQSIVETIGGTNSKLYYWMEATLHYADVFGTQKILAGIDDPFVAQVAARKSFLELTADSAAALLQGDVTPDAWTWGFPLLVGQELVGVVKLENLHLSGASLSRHLPIFFSHAALILSNEIRSHARRKIEAALAESEARFRRFVKVVPVPLAHALDNGVIQYVNDRFVQVFGYTLEDIPTIDAWWRQAYPDEDYRRWVVSTWDSAVQAAAEAGQDIQPIEYRVTCKNGEVRIMEISGVTLGDELLATFIDLTARKQTEAELTQHRHHLEQLVEERTSQLVQARDAAESANRAKSSFLSNMSHELRTPLNAILGFAQLLEHDQRLPFDMRHNVETINRAGRHLLALINDVLEISRIEAGRTRIQKEGFELEDCLRAISGIIRIRAEAKGLAFSVERRGALPRFVVGDAHHLSQVLINLLGNAVKYTDQGTVTLRLTPGDHGPTQEPGVGDSSRPLASLEDLIRFEVIDSGPGIAAEDQQRIFKPFYQTESGIAKGEGTGLGLAISQEFVRLMGGNIELRSQPGQGSVFAFTLPLPATEAPAPMSAATRRVVGLAPQQSRRRVLVAEDNADNRELICRLLQNAGFEVSAVQNGRQAIEAFQAWRPDAVCMDMRMPVLDGYQAARAIRALPEGDRVKIVAITASVFQEDRNHILSAGCDDMLAKPLDIDLLLQRLGEWLNLQLRYAEVERGAVASAPGDGNATPDLSGVDAATRTELVQAAEMLDAEAVQVIIERLRPEHPALAQTLAAWVDVYRFDAITALCRDQ